MNDQQDSIYKAPEADTSQVNADDQMAAYVGPKNAEFYLSRFRRFESGGSSIGWHWPAFFVSAFWFLYRRMWLYAFLYWIIYPVAMAFLLAAMVAALGPEAGTIAYYVGWLVVSFVLIPMFASRLYYGHARSKIDKVNSLDFSEQQKAAELYRIGGTSNVVWVGLFLVIFLIGFISAVSIPAYNDYTVRAQVSEGSSLASGARAAVTEFYLDNNALPANNAEAGLSPAEQIQGNYVSSVHVIEGAVIVTYGNDANAAIRGLELLLEPDLDTGTIEWVCRSDMIADKHLPAVCR